MPVHGGITEIAVYGVDRHEFCHHLTSDLTWIPPETLSAPNGHCSNAFDADTIIDVVFCGVGSTEYQPLDV